MKGLEAVAPINYRMVICSARSHGKQELGRQLGQLVQLGRIPRPFPVGTGGWEWCGLQAGGGGVYYMTNNSTLCSTAEIV